MPAGFLDEPSSTAAPKLGGLQRARCGWLSLERLSILPDGRVAYALRKPRKNGGTHLVLMLCSTRSTRLHRVRPT
jgi:hypothetical protein